MYEYINVLNMLRSLQFSNGRVLSFHYFVSDICQYCFVLDIIQWLMLHEEMVENKWIEILYCK